MSMRRKLFGTDGVRGIANEEPITSETALKLGRALAYVFRGSHGRHRKILIGKDTRLSGYMLETAIASGICSMGVDVWLVGPLPTPGIAFLTRSMRADAGVVISASHNPFEDNGIKFFAGDGYKLSDENELAIERELEEAASTSTAAPAIGRIRELRGAGEDYLRELHSHFAELDLSGLDVLLDCANGATHHVAPEIFRRLGAKVTVIADQPDGRNINDGCGSTHVEQLGVRVREGGHGVGFAFDGDGDRVLAVDRMGTVVDGDELMALAALHLRERDRLNGGGVVVTVMTNYGFHSAMERAGVEVAITQVGDRYVLEELRERGWVLGGEQSGHIIDLSFNRTGDGIAGALLTLEALAGRDLAERDAMQKLPQRLVNIRVRERGALESATEVNEAVSAAGKALEGRGRVLVRPSGTEPLVRVMVEAPTEDETDEVCGRLAALVELELG